MQLNDECLAILNACKHKFGKWGSPWTRIDSNMDRIRTQTRVCKSCGLAEDRQINVVTIEEG